MSLRPTYLDYYPYPAIQTTIVPALSYPFSTSPIPDVYTKITKREFDVTPISHTPSVAVRTSYNNLVLYSEQFNNGNWTVDGSTIGIDLATSPIGTVTADKIQETATTAIHIVYTTVTIVAAAVYTYSVFAKAAERGFVQIYVEGPGTNAGAYANFDLAGGTVAQGGNVGTGASFAAKIEDVGYGWKRCSVTTTCGVVSTTGRLHVGPITTGTLGPLSSYAGILNSGVYGWGAQITAGTSGGPYILTEGLARTVSAPNVDSVSNTKQPDPFAYLVDESDPVNQTSTEAKFVRTYSRIPSEQVFPTSLIISKPSLSGSFPQAFGAFRVFQPDTTLQEFDAYTAQTITSDSGVPSFYPTGGTYTLTFAGDTTASINYNDASATVQTRLNALTSVTNRGGLTVAGTYNSAGGFAVIFNAYAAATWTSSLTPTPFAVNPTQLTNNGYTQFVNGYQYTPTPITGGTFTVTIFGQTTAAINWNASTTLVAAALNLLSEVANRGNVTVTFPYGTMAATTTTAGVYYFGFLMVFGNAAITGTSSLTPAGSGLSVVIVDPPYGRTQTLTFSGGISLRTFTVPSHGILSTDTIYLKNSTTYYPGISGNITILDANTIQLAVSASASYASAAAMIELGKRTKANYQPGAATIRANKVTDFYLPGVSVGITTAADIPIPVNQSDNASFLQAVFAGTGTLNWQVGDLQQWMGPILSLQKTTINAADA